MRVLLCALLLSMPRPAGRATPDENVNSKYTIEAIEVIPVVRRQECQQPRCNPSSTRLLGQKFDPAAVDKLPADSQTKSIEG